MNFDKESESENFFFFFFFGGGGGRGGGVEGWRGGQGGRKVVFRPKICICILLFVLMLYIKFQVPSSSGSLVLTQTKGVMGR